MSPKHALLRAIAMGLVTLLLAVLLERWRRGRQITPALVEKASYDEAPPVIFPSI